MMYNQNKGRRHLIIPDPHAHPDYSNKRADYVGQLIMDLKPDVVVQMGDLFDMPSMSGYDKGTKSYQGRAYARDIAAGLEFDDRLWAPIKKAKKKKPFAVALEGNHENRLKKLLNTTPELEGTVSFKDLGLSNNYNVVVEYEGNTPGIICIDGVYYAHYFISGVKGMPISGEHPAHALITKQFASCTVGHLHTTDFAIRTDPTGRKIMGLVSGVFQDYESEWAGMSNHLWWRGVIVKDNVKDGSYDPRWISLEQLERAYKNEVQT